MKGQRHTINSSLTFIKLTTPLKHFWEVSHFILESGYFVSRLLAESFNLPKGDWHKQLEDFKTDLERYNVWLTNVIEKNEQEKALG